MVVFRAGKTKDSTNKEGEIVVHNVVHVHTATSLSHSLNSQADTDDFSGSINENELWNNIAWQNNISDESRHPEKLAEFIEVRMAQLRLPIPFWAPCTIQDVLDIRCCLSLFAIAESKDWTTNSTR